MSTPNGNPHQSLFNQFQAAAAQPMPNGPPPALSAFQQFMLNGPPPAQPAFHQPANHIMNNLNLGPPPPAPLLQDIHTQPVFHQAAQPALLHFNQQPPQPALLHFNNWPAPPLPGLAAQPAFHPAAQPGLQFNPDPAGIIQPFNPNGRPFVPQRIARNEIVNPYLPRAVNRLYAAGVQPESDSDSDDEEDPMYHKQHNPYHSGAKKRKSNKRKSNKRKSNKRKSNKRKSNKRKSNKRKSNRQ
jgi:hypothetical protein